MPTRRGAEQYWTEGQFEQLRTSPPGKLSSRGALPWRLLAYWLDASPEVDKIRELVGKRVLFGKRLEANQHAVDRMLLTLWTAGYVELEPTPPKPGDESPPQGVGLPRKEPAGGVKDAGAEDAGD